MATQGNGEVVRVQGHTGTDEAIDRIVSAFARTGSATVCFGPVHTTSERHRSEIYREVFRTLHPLGTVGLNEYFGPDPSDEHPDDVTCVYLDVTVDRSTPTITCEPTGFAIEIRGNEARLVSATEEAH